MPWRTQVDVYGWGPEWSLNGFPSRGSGVRVPFPAPYAKPCSARRSARPAPSPEHPLNAILLFPAIPRFRSAPEKPIGEAVRRRPLGLRDHMRVVPERLRRVAMPQPALDAMDRRTLVRQVGGVAVPEVVQADPRQPRTLGNAVEVAPPDVGRMQRLP